jgi:hypothetical protein
MNGEEAVRATILSGLRAGRTVSEIVSFNNVSKSTVKRLKRCYDKFIAGGGLPEDFSSERKGHRRRSDALDDNTVATLQQLVDRDPGRSMRSLARELGISEKTVRNKMKDDIYYKSYAF